MPKNFLLVILFLLFALPAFAAVEPRLAGNWKTQGPDGNELTLHLESNGRYTKTSGGKVIESGQMTAINRNWSSKSDSGLEDNGTFSVVANELVLRSTVHSTLRLQKGSSTLSSSTKPSNTAQKYNGLVSKQSSFQTNTKLSNAKPVNPVKSTPKTPTPPRTNPLASSASPPQTSYPSPYSKVSTNPLATSAVVPPSPNSSTSVPSVSTPTAKTVNPNNNPLTASKNTASVANTAKKLVSNLTQSGQANANVSGYQRKPRGWQGMAPNKGQRVGTPWGFPNQPGSANVFGGGLKASIGNLINAAKSYGIKKAIDQAGSATLPQSPAVPPAGATPNTTSTNTVAANPLASTPKTTSTPGDDWTPNRKPNSLAKGPVEWDFSGNWTMVDASGKPKMFHILTDGRYYITAGGFHVESGSIKAAKGKWALTSQSGRKDSGTFSATDNQLTITSQSAGTSKWSRIGKKIPEPVKQAKSNYKPKRSGFSRTYGGYTEYYGGGRMRHWNRGH